MKEIKTKTLKSIKWVLLSNLLPKLITPIISIYLATILVPQDYGVVAISAAIIGFINIVQGFGVIDFIGKEKTIDNLKLNTAFWLNIGLGLIFFILLSLGSSFFSNLYKEPLLSSVIPISAFVIIFDSLGVVHFAILRREMKFKKLFFRSLIPIVISIGVTLPLAVWGYGVWALIYGQIARSFFSSLLFWVLSKWRPSFIYSKNIIYELFRFGGWNNFEKIQEYFSNNSLGILILGYFSSSNLVGVYSVALHITGTLFLVLRAPIQNMTMPVLSKVQDSKRDLISVFKKIISRMMLINFPLIIGVFLLAEMGVQIIFPDKWSDLGLVVSIIIIGQGLVNNFGAQRELLKILNKPQVYPKTVSLNLMIGSILFFIAASYGDIYWFCIARLINDCIFMIIQIIIINKHIGVKYLEIIDLALTPFISALIMGIAIYMIKSTLFFDYSLLFFIVMVCVSVLVYFISYYIIDKKEAKKILNEFKTIIGVKSVL